MFVYVTLLVLVLLFFSHGVVLLAWCCFSFHISVKCKQGKVDHGSLFFVKKIYMKKF